MDAGLTQDIINGLFDWCSTSQRDGNTISGLEVSNGLKQIFNQVRFGMEPAETLMDDIISQCVFILAGNGQPTTRITKGEFASVIQALYKSLMLRGYYHAARVLYVVGSRGRQTRGNNATRQARYSIADAWEKANEDVSNGFHGGFKYPSLPTRRSNRRSKKLITRRRV